MATPNTLLKTTHFAKNKKQKNKKFQHPNNKRIQDGYKANI